MTEPLTIEVLAQRVKALEAQLALKVPPPATPWTAADNPFDQGEESVAFRRRMDEEVENARAADRAALGLDGQPVGHGGRQA